jgi:hypothetical protein
LRYRGEIVCVHHYFTKPKRKFHFSFYAQYAAENQRQTSSHSIESIGSTRPRGHYVNTEGVAAMFSAAGKSNACSETKALRCERASFAIKKCRHVFTAPSITNDKQKLHTRLLSFSSDIFETGARAMDKLITEAPKEKTGGALADEAMRNPFVDIAVAAAVGAAVVLSRGKLASVAESLFPKASSLLGESIQVSKASTGLQAETEMPELMESLKGAGKRVTPRGVLKKDCAPSALGKDIESPLSKKPAKDEDAMKKKLAEGGLGAPDGKHVRPEPASAAALKKMTPAEMYARANKNATGDYLAMRELARAAAGEVRIAPNLTPTQVVQQMVDAGGSPTNITRPDILAEQRIIASGAQKTAVRAGIAAKKVDYGQLPGGTTDSANRLAMGAAPERRFDFLKVPGSTTIN